MEQAIDVESAYLVQIQFTTQNVCATAVGTISKLTTIARDQTNKFVRLQSSIDSFNAEGKSN